MGLELGAALFQNICRPVPTTSILRSILLQYNCSCHFTEEDLKEMSLFFILFYLKKGKRIRRWIGFVFPPTNDVNESQKIDIKVITMLCHGQFLVHFLIETLFLGRDLYLCLWVLFWYIFYS